MNQAERPSGMANTSSGGGKRRILVCDDHLMIREAIRPVLEQAGFEVDEAWDKQSSIDKISKNGAYDIVLLDFNMPDMAGLESIGSVMEANAPHDVVLLSGAASPMSVTRALSKGIKGYIPKSSSMKSLVSAIKLVLSGEIYVPYSFFQSSAGADKSLNSEGSKGNFLTEREKKILYAVANGESNKQIAHDLGLSEVTIKVAMRSICEKLDAKNRTQAAIIAKQLQIV